MPEGAFLGLKVAFIECVSKLRYNVIDWRFQGTSMVYDIPVIVNYSNSSVSLKELV